MVNLQYFMATRERSSSWAETFLLSLVCFCLPLFEAPKNLLSVVFLSVWSLQSIRHRNWGRVTPFDLPIVGLAVLLWIAPFFSAFGDTVTPLNSAPRWTLLALVVVASAHLNYDRRQLLVVCAAVMVGGVAAVIESLVLWYSNGKPYPEFRSVGHVNHSSMYSLVPLAVGLGSLYLNEYRFKILGLIAIFSTLVFLPPSKSIVGGAAITAVLIVSASVGAVRKWHLRGLWASTLAGILIVAFVLSMPFAEGLRSELVARATGDDVFSGRDKILNSALAVWDQHPLLGTGWFSFGMATSEVAVRAALEADGLEYDPSIYFHYPHGHNLWTTLLIERGLIGVVLATILLAMYFKTFLPIAFSRDPLDPSDRGAAVGALLVAVGFVVAGLGNTTMMNEHGQAGMIVIAVAYGYLTRSKLLLHIPD